MSRWTPRTALTFFSGVLCGAAAGAFLLASVVWHHGNVIGSREAARLHPPHPPLAIERWKGEPDDGGEGVLRVAAAEHAVATAGRAADAATPPTMSRAEADPGASAAPPLADRDLLIPVDGVSAGDLTASFTEPRGRRRHEAIDILAPRNTPVRAVDGGTIARMFQSRAGGLTVYQFDPGQQYVYYYAHLERYAEGLEEADRVERGQIIGYVGTSGNAPPGTPHLHFAIYRLTSDRRWWEGTPIDPYPLLRRSSG